LDDRHRLDDRGRPDLLLFKLGPKADQQFGRDLPDAVVAEERQDVKIPHARVQRSGCFAQVRHGVQSPVRLDEFAHLDVIRDACVSHLLAAADPGEVVLSVLLAVEDP
jgi:hypothetical protein